MNIAIVGTGYVGLVSGTCFSELGLNVVCVDVDEKKIEILNKGIIPIYEPGLERMVMRNVAADRLRFSSSLKEVLNEVDVVFIAVGTPPGEDGSADMRYVLEVAKTIGENINTYKLIVVKSTVPVETSERVRSTIQKELDNRKADVEFDVASNPEFLKEGDAINDFMKPDRVVAGVDSEKAQELMTNIYPSDDVEQLQGYFYGYSVGGDDQVCIECYVGYQNQEDTCRGNLSRNRMERIPIAKLGSCQKINETQSGTL